MSKRRERRAPQTGDFDDPLKDYTGPKYEDELERSLCEDEATVIEHQPFLTVSPDTSILEMLRLMSAKSIACVVVTDELEKPVGIVSEQDVVHRVMTLSGDLATQPVSLVMTHDPVVTYESETPARVMNIMGSGFFRHLPLCDMNERLIGVIGARRLIDYLQKQVGDMPG